MTPYALNVTKKIQILEKILESRFAASVLFLQHIYVTLW